MTDRYIEHSAQWFEPDEYPDVYCPCCSSRNPDTIYRIDDEIRCDSCVAVISDWDEICRILEEE